VLFREYQEILGASSMIFSLHCILLTFGEAESFDNTFVSEWTDNYQNFIEHVAGDEVYGIDSPLLTGGAHAS
jgi:hypothetical protein